jgi:hypothetical protein
MDLATNLRMLNLRVVAPPLGGTDTSVSYVDPTMYQKNAGAVGLAQNAAIQASQPPIARSIETNTANPNPTTNVGADGTPGLPGNATSLALVPHDTSTAITGPGPTVARVPRNRRTNWKEIGLIVGGVAVVILVLR